MARLNAVPSPARDPTATNLERILLRLQNIILSPDTLAGSQSYAEWVKVGAVRMSVLSLVKEGVWLIFELLEFGICARIIGACRTGCAEYSSAIEETGDSGGFGAQTSFDTEAW